jgi:hypothetical protein
MQNTSINYWRKYRMKETKGRRKAQQVEMRGEKEELLDNIKFWGIYR